MKKIILLFSISILLGGLARLGGLTTEQALIVSVFSISISGTLLFRDFRLAFVFIGGSILFVISSVNIAKFIEFASVDVILFVVMIVLIALHKRLEILAGMAENDLLIILPIVFAGLFMFLRPAKIRSYIENEIEWASLLFFMFLFAQAGVIQSSGVAEFLAKRLVESTGSHPKMLSAVTLFSSGILSGTLDNTVVVASYIPVVKNLHLLHFGLKPLWWCLLFGACFGGNITAIGSTANIVALGLLDKERNQKIDFVAWLKLGLTVGIVSLAISYVAVVFLPVFSR